MNSVSLFLSYEMSIGDLEFLKCRASRNAVWKYHFVFLTDE
jgi:hypothetical protein